MFITNNIERMRISNAGVINFGTLGSSSTAVVNGTLQVTGAPGRVVNFVTSATAGTVTYILPTVSGSANQVLITTGAGTLAWANDAGGSVTNVTAGTGLTGGTINTTGTINLAVATASSLGGVSIGSGLGITAAGTLSANVASNSTQGIANFGTGLTISSGSVSVDTTNLATTFFKQGGNNFGAAAVVGTTDAKDLYLRSSGTTGISIQASTGYVGIGNANPTETLDVTGDIKSRYYRTHTMTRTLPTVVNDEVDIGSFVFSNGAGALWVSVVSPNSSFSVAKEYMIPIKYGQTSNTWTAALPTSSTGSYGGNDFDLDVNVANGTASLRLRRTLGSTAGTAYVIIKQEGIDLH